MWDLLIMLDRHFVVMRSRVVGRQKFEVVAINFLSEIGESA